MPTRRRYLALVAGLAAGAAGCGAPAQEETTTAPTTTTTPAATTTESPYTRVYRQTVDSVVFVRTRSPQGTGAGSGFVVGDDTVVTNHHVVADAETVEVRFNRGEWRDATVLGSEPYSDLAALEMPVPDYADPLSWVAEEPAVGTEVVAIGNPFGLDRSVSAGIVSGVDRSIPLSTGGIRVPDAIQTDAAVNPGNSGGPLVTLDGRVAGVISAGGGENIAFAVSAGLARRVIPALVGSGDYDHAYMGVRVEAVSPSIAEANGLDRARGVLVTAVLRGGPADGVLQPATDTTVVDGVSVPVGGDVLLAVDGTDIESSSDLASFLALETSPGDTVAVTLLRGGERRTVDLELGSRPPPGAVGSTGV